MGSGLLKNNVANKLLRSIYIIPNGLDEIYLGFTFPPHQNEKPKSVVQITFYWMKNPLNQMKFA